MLYKVTLHFLIVLSAQLEPAEVIKAKVSYQKTSHDRDILLYCCIVLCWDLVVVIALIKCQGNKGADHWNESSRWCINLMLQPAASELSLA